MSVTLATGVTLIDFINKSLETLKLIQKDEVDSTEINLHLATLTQQLSLTMVEAAQLQGQLAQKNEEIRQLKKEIETKRNLKFDNGVWWLEGDDTPFCPICKESDALSIHLNFVEAYSGSEYTPPRKAYWACKKCKNKYTYT